MSSKILPPSKNSDKASRLKRRDDEAPRDGSRSLEHSHAFNETSGRGREADSAGETRRIPRRASQLPQKASARKISTHNHSSKETDRLGVLLAEDTKVSLRGASAELIGKSGLVPTQRPRDISSRRETRTMLPPMKSARSLSTQRQKFDSAHTKIGTPKNRSDSRPDAPVALTARSRSSIEPLEMSLAKVEPRTETHQASQGASRNESTASDIAGPGLVTSNSRYHGTDDVSGHVRARSDFNLALTTASQQLLGVTLPPAELATRKISNTHQYRPPFSTLQRHFSPKKVRGGSIAPALIHPTTKHSSSYELSSENVQIQTELTQLHLLLHPAVEVQKEWERSAKECLQSRFQDLRERHKQLKGLVQSHQAFVNHSALIAWCNSSPGVKVAEKLQLLSHNFQDVLALIEAGGMYTRILNTFELWFARACCIRDSRDRPWDPTGKDLKFLESIGADWKVEVAGLEMKLSSCLRELRNEGKSQGNSTLAQFLISFQRVLTNLLDELGVIRGIESDLMTQEASEIEAMIALSATAYESDASSIPASYQGIWHAGV